GTAKTATVNLVDNDLSTTVKPTITISTSDANAGETVAGTTVNRGQFRLTRTGDLSSSLTVNYAVAGTATNGTDYQSLSGTTTFSAGASTALINVNPVDDALVEGNETVIVTLASSANYVLGTAKTGTVTIVDNDPAPFITVTSPNGAEPLVIGSNYNLSWADNIAENVKIDLYKGGVYNRTIFSSTLSDGSENWLLPADLVAGSDYSIKITSVNNGNVSDLSNSNFSIIPNHTGLINDINKDGKHDIMWRSYSDGGTTHFWAMNGGGTNLGDVDIPDYLDMAWHPVAMADFNNDGNMDIVWRYHWIDNTGHNRIWLMDGNNRLAEVGIERVADNNWHIVGSGDFNLDGNADILWRNYATGENHIWQMSGTTRTTSIILAPVTDLNQRIVGTGDFNGDGKSDILWRNAATGELYIWFMDGFEQNLSSSPDLTWSVAGTGDMNNDGKSDIIWRNLNTGENTAWLMNGATKLGDLDIPDAPRDWNIVGDSDMIPIWTAEYFNNKDLAGTPTYSEGFINITGGFSKNWGAGAPPNTPVDNFSARYKTQQYLAAGLHKINVAADDSVRVWIGNQLVIDSWGTLASNRLEYFSAPGGFSPVKVEYKEEGGSAGINFEVVKHQRFNDSPDSSKEWAAVVLKTNGVGTPSANYNDHIGNEIGTIKLARRNDGKEGISAYWGTGSPNGDSRLPVDNFFIRAHTISYFDGGEYKFRFKADDGIQLFAYGVWGTQGGGYITPQDQWVQAYGYQEVTYTLPAGWYTLHFQMWEGGIDALVDVSWEKTVVAPTGYYSQLNTFSESQWDQQSGDNNQFEANPLGGGGDQRWKTDDRIEQIYTDLSHTIFGYRVAMTAGYAYDQSYYNGLGKWHAGLDMGAGNGTTIKAAIGGSVAWISGSADGYVFVGINSDDGRQWVYGHLKSTSGLWNGKRINAGDTVGLVGYYGGAPHLHLEVQNGHAYGNTQGAMTNQSTLLNVTVSPLLAYWQWRNR
ncbi:FG-GAP-like repeat-containing protein, partial [Anabaena sp. UHCC 0451]|uniref:FG-GAP-like repeat-containing protein n=1 Tax=Anabaena sp. UHCC 0451 TaxID=2055235 RepID=UPI002B211F27